MEQKGINSGKKKYFSGGNIKAKFSPSHKYIAT